ncbi:MAG: hypothetical protein J6J23_01805 [Clostridia bacterium]|nr:hypothetical protein [Clostridia bacterium]
MNKNQKVEMITQSTILEMGWTKSMITKLLPEPTLKPNPHYRSAAPMRIWKKQDVLDAMETENFKLELEKANKRKISSKKAQNTKINNLAEKMKQIAEGITVSILPQEELEAKTLKHQECRIYEHISNETEYLERHCNSSESFEEYERSLEEMENFRMHRPNNEATMHRWIVNYIRHNLIAYDQTLRTLKGKTGKDEAYIIFKLVVLEKIAAAYPCYADECNRQISDMRSYYAI